MTRLPFARPIPEADCPTCHARTLVGSPALDALDRLSRAVRDAQASGVGFLGRLDLADARAIVEATRRGVRPHGNGGPGLVEPRGC